MSFLSKIPNAVKFVIFLLIIIGLIYLVIKAATTKLICTPYPVCTNISSINRQIEKFEDISCKNNSSYSQSNYNTNCPGANSSVVEYYNNNVITITDAANMMMFYDSPDIEVPDSSGPTSLNLKLYGNSKKSLFTLDFKTIYKTVTGFGTQKFANLSQLATNLSELHVAVANPTGLYEVGKIQVFDFPQSVANNIFTWLTMTDCSYVLRKNWNDITKINKGAVNQHCNGDALIDSIQKTTYYINNEFELSPRESGVNVVPLTYGNYSYLTGKSNGISINSQVPMGCIVSNTKNDKNIFCLALTGTTWSGDLIPQIAGTVWEGTGFRAVTSAFAITKCAIYDDKLKYKEPLDLSISAFYCGILEGKSVICSPDSYPINNNKNPKEQILNFLTDRISEIERGWYTYTNPLIINITGHSMGGAMSQIVIIYVLCVLGNWLKAMTPDETGRYICYINCVLFAPPAILKHDIYSKILKLPGFENNPLPNVNIVAFGNYYNRYVYGPQSIIGLQVDPVYYGGCFGTGAGKTYLIVPRKNSFLCYTPSYIYNPWITTGDYNIHVTLTFRKYLLDTNAYWRSLSTIDWVMPLIDNVAYDYTIGWSYKLFAIAQYPASFIVSAGTGITAYYTQEDIMSQIIRNLDINNYYSNIFSQLLPKKLEEAIIDLTITQVPDLIEYILHNDNPTIIYKIINFWGFLASIPCLYKKIWSINEHSNFCRQNRHKPHSNETLAQISGSIKTFISELGIFASNFEIYPLTTGTSGIPIGIIIINKVITTDVKVNVYISFSGNMSSPLTNVHDPLFFSNIISNLSNIEGLGIPVPKFYLDILTDPSNCPLGTNCTHIIIKRKNVSKPLTIIEQITQVINIACKRGFDPLNPNSFLTRPKIKIIGHSLGGALAQITAILLFEFYKKQWIVQTILFSPTQAIEISTLSQVDQDILTNCVSFSQYCNFNEKMDDQYHPEILQNVYLDLISYPEYNSVPSIKPLALLPSINNQYLLMNSIVNINKDIHSLNSMMLNIYNQYTSEDFKAIISYATVIEQLETKVPKIYIPSLEHFQSGPLFPQQLMGNIFITSQMFNPTYEPTQYMSVFLILQELKIQNTLNCPVSKTATSLSEYKGGNVFNLYLYIAKLNQIMYKILSEYINNYQYSPQPTAYAIESQKLKTYTDVVLNDVINNNTYSCVKLLISGQNNQANLCGMILETKNTTTAKMCGNLIFVFCGSTVPLTVTDPINFESYDHAITALNYIWKENPSSMPDNPEKTYSVIKYYYDQLHNELINFNLDGRLASNIIDQYRAIINNYLSNIYTVYPIKITITGHGIGGSLAQLVYIDLRQFYSSHTTDKKLIVELIIFNSTNCLSNDFDTIAPDMDLGRTMSFGLCTNGKNNYCDPVFGDYTETSKSLVPVDLTYIFKDVYTNLITLHKLSSYNQIFTEMQNPNPVSGPVSNYITNITYDNSEINFSQKDFSSAEDMRYIVLCDYFSIL